MTKNNVLNTMNITLEFVPGFGIYGYYTINNGTTQQIPYKISNVVFFRQDGEDIKVLCERILTSYKLPNSLLRDFSVKVKQSKIKSKSKITGLKSKSDEIFIYKDKNGYDGYSLYIDANLINLSKAEIKKQRINQKEPQNFTTTNYMIKFVWTSNLGMFEEAIFYDSQHYNFLCDEVHNKLLPWRSGCSYKTTKDIDEPITKLENLKKELTTASEIWSEKSGVEIYEYLKAKEFVRVSAKGEPEYVR